MFRRFLSAVSQLNGGSMRKRLYVRLGAFAVLLTAGVLGIGELQKLYNGKRAATTANANDGLGGTKPEAGQPGSEKPSSPPVTPPSTPRMPQPVPGDELQPPPTQPPSSSFSNPYSDVRTASTFGTPRSIGDDPPTSSYTMSDAPPKPAAGSSYYGGGGATGTDPTGVDDAGTTDSQAPPSDPTTASRFQDGAPPLVTTSTGRYGAAPDAENPAGAAADPSATTSADSPVDPMNAGDATAGGQPPTTSYGVSDRPSATEPREFVEPGRAAPTTTLSDAEPGAGAGSDPRYTSGAGTSTLDSSSNISSRFQGASDAARDYAAPTSPRSDGLSSFPNTAPSIPASTLPGRQSVTAAPGPPELEGVQTPSLSIEKTAPDEVQVGREATFQILVRNVGQVAANEIIVSDRVPQGARLVATNPQTTTTDGMIVWRLGALLPGGEAEVTYTIVPEVEGELGSVAQVVFAAQASARTMSTRPVVKLDVEMRPSVLIGESVAVVIMLRNEGTGPARGVVVEEDVPAGLTHPAGRELENTIGVLGPGESRRIELALTAAKAGATMNVVRVRDDGDLQLVQETPIEVVAPQLEIGVAGPALRYLERQATHEIAVQNPGTAAAQNVELVAFLPRGLKFVSATKLGQYSPQQHAVLWHLEQLPPDKSGVVQLVTLPVVEGEQKLRVESRGALDISAVKEHSVRVESVAELFFSIADTADPIEVGAETTYAIEVTNQGTKADTNIVLAAALPDELEPVGAEGPTDGVVQGKQVQFAPLAQLGPREKAVFRIRARGALSGDSRLLVQVRSDQAPKPVSKEESTKVYAD